LKREANSTQKREISHVNISETTKDRKLNFWNYKILSKTNHPAKFGKNLRGWVDMLSD